MQPLCDLGQVVFAAEETPGRFERGEGSPDVSGTKVREHLQQGNFELFAAAMPAGVNVRNVWRTLTNSEPSVSESSKYSLMQALYAD